MSDGKKPGVGTIGWFDLTVKDAEKLRGFYESVVGWTSQPLDMGGYADYCMNEPGSGKTVAGVCHARGVNAKLPPQWILYVTVADLERSTARCVELGGQVIDGPREA